MFGALKKLATSAMNNYSGNKDFLEACAAAASLVAAAEGGIDDDEIEAAIATMLSNETLAAAYSPAEIEAEVSRQMKRAGTISGRIQLKRELEDVARKDIVLRQDVFLTAANVADSDGSIGPAEQKALDGIAKILNVDSRDLIG
jgi:tellurite resistance protein